MGGDRDGHPFVTADITAQTCQWLREAAIAVTSGSPPCAGRFAQHFAAAIAGLRSGSKSESKRSAASGRQLVQELEGHGKLESYRRWLRVVRWRLEQTAAVELTRPAAASAAIASADEFAADVDLIRAGARSKTATPKWPTNEVQAWLDQIAVFGFHTARLDVRQHAAVYREVMEEFWRGAG